MKPGIAAVEARSRVQEAKQERFLFCAGYAGY